MAYIDFVSDLHKATKRDYVARVMEAEKSECAIIAKNKAMSIGMGKESMAMVDIDMTVDGE